MKKQLLLILFSFCFIGLHAQKMEHSTRKVISSKAAKGSLFEYYINEETQEIELVYKIKETKKKVVLETYYFKRSDLSFIRSKEDEIAKEKLVRRKRKIKEGEQISLLRVIPNVVTGQIKMAKGYLTYRYVGRGVFQTFHETKKVKPKGMDGDRMIYLHHRTQQPRMAYWGGLGTGHISMGVGNVMLLAIENKTPLYGEVQAMVYDAHTLTRKYSKSIDLGYSFVPVAARDLPNGNMGVLFKSINEKDYPKGGYNKKSLEHYKVAPTFTLKYLELNTKCEVVHDTEIKVPEPESGYTLNLSMAVSEDAQTVTIMGLVNPMTVKGPPYHKIFPLYVNQQPKPIDLNKPQKTWVIKLQQGQVKFINEFSPEKLLEGAQQPAGEDELGLNPDSKGVKKLLAPGANYRPVSSKDINGKTLLYSLKGNNLIHVLILNESGQIDGNYFFNYGKKRIISADMNYHFNSNGELFLFYYEQPKPKDGTPEEQNKAKSKWTGNVVKVDLTTNQLGPPLNLSPDASLDLYDWFFWENTDSVLTLGRGKKKEIVLSRINLK